MERFDFQIDVWIGFLLGIVCGWTGGYLGKLGYNANYYCLTILRILCMVPFYQFGKLYKNKQIIIEKLNNSYSLLLILLFQLVLINIYQVPVGYSISGVNFYYNILISYLTGFLAITFWVYLSRFFEPIIREKAVIQIISDNTYTIMVNHPLGFFIVKLIFGTIAKMTPFFSDFDYVRLKEDVTYFYLPNGISLWYSVYVIMGIWISLLMQRIVSKMWKEFRRLIWE